MLIVDGCKGRITLYEYYSLAESVLSKSPFSYDLFRSFLVSNIDSLVGNDGIFISVGLNLVPEKEIVYDLPSSHLIHIGYKLQSDKSLLVLSDLGDSALAFAEGVAVVYGGSGRGLFGYSKSFLVNCGSSGDFMGIEVSDGPIFNFGVIGELSGSGYKNLFVNVGPPVKNQDYAHNHEPQKGFYISVNNDFPPNIRKYKSLQQPGIARFPALLSYLNELKQIFMSGRSDPESVFRFLRSNPGKSIVEHMASITPGTEFQKRFGRKI